MPKLDYLYDWFRKYAQTYYTDDKFIMDRVLLKEQHSQRVATNTLSIAKYLTLDERQQRVAEVIGLFHDIARFRQITEYRTFVDAESFDHGDVGARELVKTGILQDFSPTDREIITFAIVNHNKMVIAPAPPEKVLFAKIIRDADKLDIFRVLPPIQADHNYAPKMLEQLKQARVLAYTDVKSLADKRLIRLSWFYDIAFDWTLQQLIKEGWLDRQLAALPDNEDCTAVKETMKAYITKRMSLR